jgi:hypothetical protein
MAVSKAILMRPFHMIPSRQAQASFQSSNNRALVFEIPSFHSIFPTGAALLIPGNEEEGFRKVGI